MVIYKRPSTENTWENCNNLSTVTYLVEEFEKNW